MHQNIFKCFSISYFILLLSTSYVTCNRTIEMYGLALITPDEGFTAEKRIIDIYGEEVNNITQAYLSRSFSCGPKSVKLKRIELEEYRARYKAPDANLLTSPRYFFCTIPESYQINSMLHNYQLINMSWLPVLGVIFCFLLVMSAIFSGLNLAIMSYSINDLSLIEEYDNNPINRTRASQVLMVRKDTNYVLCSIITGNVLCNCLITLILDFFATKYDLDESMIVELTSTIFQLVFTEVLPAVLCTKKALYFASKMRHIVIFFMVLTFPLAYPISRLLDIAVGKDDSVQDGGDMLVGLRSIDSNTNKDFDEVVDLVRNTLKLSRKTASDVMTPIKNVFMISDKQVVSKQFLNSVVSKGHTRLPVCSSTDVNTIRGVLNVKDLVLMLADDASASKLTAATLIDVLGKSQMYRYVLGKTPVPQLMTELEKGCPMAIVIEFIPKYEAGKTKNTINQSSNTYRVIGIVTLEDNIEEVVGEIVDERDLRASSSTEFGINSQKSAK